MTTTKAVPAHHDHPALAAWKGKIYGIVQGIGFRPFVQRLADEFHLAGYVSNKGSYVEIHVQGNIASLHAFRAALPQRAPERSSILKINWQETDRDPACHAFQIISSTHESGDIYVSPDIAICHKCKAELFDKHNRRYLHPFINCTACGPRLTILEAMPYDRERTSMKDFPMCSACRHEYTHAASRRYDAQPVCCNDCGPEVYLLGQKDRRGPQAITAARRVLASGGIIAVKGIGGFHLCCDATNEAAVAELRRRKHRPQKPFAVMMKDLAITAQECELLDGEKELLDSPQAPILLLKKKPASRLCPSVAPGNPKVGIMLPYAPLQLLLFSYPDGLDVSDMLIMTSGNPAGAPICHNDTEASTFLSPIADLILSHNRQIRLRADDSVMDFNDAAPSIIRRSRGYAPLPVSLDSNGWHGQVLGIGGELKNTFCLAKNGLFYPSPYIGDMTDLRTIDSLQDSLQHLEGLLEIEPSLVACDLHPRYHTTGFAHTLDRPLLPVQHHYAHIISCLAENNTAGPVIGVACDGTGYGTDHTIWGGEFLLADYHGFQRLGSIHPFWQAGGDIASREGWRIAISMLYSLYDKDKEKTAAVADRLALCRTKELQSQFLLADTGLNRIKSTSTGRLFDAVSAILGIRRTSTFEGEASMALQFAADASAQHALPGIPALPAGADTFILPTDKLLQSIIEKRLAGWPIPALAWEFHAGLAAQILAGCEAARAQTGLSITALSGGVFQNSLLLHLCTELLQQHGFTVLRHHLIPANDGGLSLGQAVIAQFHLNEQH